MEKIAKKCMLHIFHLEQMQRQSTITISIIIIKWYGTRTHNYRCKWLEMIFRSFQFGIEM